MNIYGMIYPQMAYSEIYYDTDVLMYCIRSISYIRTTVDREKPAIEVMEGNNIKKRFMPGNYLRHRGKGPMKLTDFEKAMFSFINSLAEEDILLFPDITYLGRTASEIHHVYHEAWDKGVYLEFNKTSTLNTAGYVQASYSGAGNVLQLIDIQIDNCINDLKNWTTDFGCGSNIQDLGKDAKKN